MDDFGFGVGRTPFSKAHCGDNENMFCFTTSDRGFLNQSDAILFHVRDLSPNDLPPPEWRKPQQHFVFVLYESPVNTDLGMLRQHFKNYFNRTMTYRRDSDIVSLHTYGRIKCKNASIPNCLDFPRKEIHIEDISENTERVQIDFSKKNRTIAWFVSNCHSDSKRERLVLELSRYIKVDIYGPCSENYCDDGEFSDEQNCSNLLNFYYRFYLSFENSLCPDYVTEKVYRPLAQNTVPVVFGGSDYSHYLPSGSYVNAFDYSSPRELANHLHKLMVDDKLYSMYFQWKGKYVVDQETKEDLCQLCQLISDTNLKEKTYTNIDEWWSGKFTNYRCISPPMSLVS